jgi:hypothetical protein
LAIFRAGLSIAPPRGSAVEARVLALGRRSWFFALLLVLCLFYAFVGSAGIAHWPVYGVYHDLQADAFLKGQLHLPVDPAPELLKAKDPYSRANIRYWWLDASFYHGKYYIYWGPVPALIEAAAKWVLGIHHAVGDQYLVVFFHCLTFCCGALLIERMLKRLFASSSRWLLVLGVLVFACANPFLHGEATPSTYEVAIIAAQAWLCAGVLFAFDAVWHAGSPSARRSRLLAAGVCWALGLGSRVSVLPAIALLIPLTAWLEALPTSQRFRRFVVDSLLLGVPVVLTGFGLLAYNKLRFDNWLEFGANIQLSGFPLIHFSAAFVPANLYSYIFRSPAGWSCEFPYVQQTWLMGARAFPAGWFTFAPEYDVGATEPVIGWALMLPLTWLSPLAFAFAPRPWRPAGRRDRAYLFCLFAFTLLASATGVIALFAYAVTMRYLEDVVSGLALLALLGAFALRFHRYGRLAPRLVSALIAALSVPSIVLGLLLGYQGYNHQFHSYNPVLDHKLVEALSLCRKPSTSAASSR